MQHTLRIYKDPAELAVKAARHFARLADQYVLGNGRFTVALAGGSTPKAMYSLLAEEPFLDTLPWKSVFFFFGDERTVPADHPDSNFRMASEALLSKVPVPASNVFRIVGEDADAHASAARYAEQLESFFAAGAPRLDLVLLGLGTDGHTASLFPNSTALKSSEEYVVANFVEKFQRYRITLTAKTINLARNVTFLVSGYDKAEALHRVIEGPFNPDELPSQLIRPNDGGLLWMVDEAAQSLLRNPRF
jgi:6-phosphogluconolactonase